MSGSSISLYLIYLKHHCCKLINTSRGWQDGDAEHRVGGGGGPVGP